MSSWTVVTLRAREGKHYEHSEYDGPDPASAMEDICATLDEDDRVRDWTMDSPHAYALTYQGLGRDEDDSKSFLADYEEMVEDAVVLFANDTSDTGSAKYYPVRHSLNCTDEYNEYEMVDGRYVGQIAMAMINADHRILARDPFHSWMGEFDGRYAEDGTSRLD
jgi:hypothetical protein